MKMFRVFFFLLFITLNAAHITTTTVKNLRAVAPGCIYRSATLDELSQKDAEELLNGSALGSSQPLAAVIDLRNSDEIQKGIKERSDGSKTFYAASTECNFLHIPFLKDVDAFWEEAINRMNTADRFKATMETIFQAGALDRAAARNLEKGGHAMLNTIIMTSGQRQIATALEACLEESRRGPVIFHCQKGKDRTGVLGMLIQSILDPSSQNENEIIKAYALSGSLLGEEEGYYTAKDKINDGSGGLIDWSYFRGSPERGMKETLQWTNDKFGSVEAYLDSIAFDSSKRSRFRKQMLECQKELA